MTMASAVKINLSLALSKILMKNFKDGWWKCKIVLQFYVCSEKYQKRKSREA